MSFPQSVTSCGETITAAQYAGFGLIGINANTFDPPGLDRSFSIYQNLGGVNSIAVGERDGSGTLVDGPFTLVAHC